MIGIGIGIGRNSYGTEGAASDPDAQAFFDRVTTAGGTLSDTEKLAVNTLVLQMKADGIWTKMKAIYPMVGASATACKQNLKSSSFTGSFSSGWSFSRAGATGKGTSTSMSTSFIPNNEFLTVEISLSTYLANNSSGITIGNTSTRIYDWRFNNLASVYNQNGVAINGSQNGLAILNRNNGTEFEYKRNNESIQTLTQSASSLSSTEMIIGSFGTAFYADGTFSFAHIGDNLTSSEQGDLYTAVQAFNTTLSREV